MASDEFSSNNTNTPLLNVEDLTIRFNTATVATEAVNGLSFEIEEGERVGIVGESGAGKSVTAQSIMNLIDSPGEIVAGSIEYQGEDIREFGRHRLQAYRGSDVGMVFQDVDTHLNPVYTIGEQVAETIRLHNDISRSESRDRAIEMLERVGIPNAAERFSDYPHAFSGGMKQRVLIAIALACDPSVLIADEPTTALDVTTEAQILRLVKELCEDTGTAVLFITHDLSVVAELCDRVIVMYAGEIVENSPVENLFEDPLHPYTEGLLSSLPSQAGENEEISSISGEIPDPTDLPSGCSFHPRCPYAVHHCQVENPPLVDNGDRAARCFKYVDGVEVDD